ncbi:M3 family metallopeptidase [Mucilaginibacter sp. RS28]|uniref:M3 family metallopeptidase n=1 Tax=Mucilaginibacter straminoryzae TaxID=2932774 RepID=A0A9X1X0V7_9SPHI|nr:M3 family metallopeptidase [Mucilaginibacter straminoryzae]MCJ8209094.1 M3 family metallopeptidase [Mucilaginibacter straminoryzae]
MLICSSFCAHSQQFDPFDGQAASFHVRFSRYFKNEADEKATRARLLDSIAVLKRDTAWSPENLRAHLDTYERLLVAMERHLCYFTLKCYVNNKDTLARQAYDQLDASTGALQGMVSTRLLKPAFISLTDEQLSNYGLTAYRYLLKQAACEAVHNLSDKEEAMAHQLSDVMVDHLINRYDALMDNIKADSVQSGSIKYDPVTALPVILKSPDSTLRRKGTAAYHQAYARHADVLATTLIDLTMQKTAMARLRGFKSATERAYLRRLQLPEAAVKEMLAEIARHTDVLQNYQRIQADQVSRMTGIKNVHSWDASLPLSYKAQALPYAQARSLILTALEPLGMEYGQAFSKLLDPANGELDIAGGPNRVTEFTSVGFPGVPESLYMRSYNGTIREISRLAHEGGHATHEQLMSDHLSVPSYKNGPSFLFEAYAIFNELLLMDELEKRAPTPAGKAYFTKMFLDKLSLELFTSAEEGAFEQGLYEGVVAGTINDRRGVDSLYAGIMNKYDRYFASEPERRSEWINKRLLYDDPIYNVNYLYAMLVSCKLYTMAHEDQKNFARKYAALLKNGFDAPADALLQKFMDFKLNHTDLLNGALKLMKDKTLQLQKIYGQVK